LHALSLALALLLLLLVAFLMGGARPRGGYRRRSAYTGTKARGTPRRATVTAGDCSFYPLLGPALEAEADRLAQARVNSFTARGSSTSVTATRGASGEPPERAGSGEA